jgi:uncharacterized protein
MTSERRPLALVTGASAGIGMAYAERLAQDGWDLIITGRREERLTDLAARLHGELGVEVEPVVADLNAEEGMGRIDDLCRRRELDMLVNNAGMAHYMPFLDLPDEDLRELVMVDALAPTVLTHSAVRGMVERGRGSIINLASLLAFSDAISLPTFPKRVVYASTRAYMVVFTRLLAEELEGTGVKVTVVCPGIVRSEFHSRQGMDMTGRPRIEPEAIVQASLVALDRGEVVCIPTLDDLGLITARDEAQATLVRTTLSPNLAARYEAERPQ